LSEEGVAVPVVGMVGAGQLARMTAQAAVPLGVRLRVLAADPADSAVEAAAEIVLGAPDDPAGLAALAKGADIVTFDHELVEPALLEALERDGAAVRPGSDVIAVVIDKRRQREALARLGAPQPPHAVVAGAEDIDAFALVHGWPLVLKAARGGYDGRGVWVVADPPEAAAVLAEADAREVVLLAERLVPLDCELAVMVARRPSGDVAVYPAVQTVQRDGMLRELAYPAPVTAALAEQARELARGIAEGLGVVGVLAVELFVSGGELLVNELAARPHNSGHASIEACVTSQFENHLRAVLDWPLGDPSPVAPAFALVNVVGPADGSDPAGRSAEALAVPGLHLHLYGKAAKPGRKLGHVTVVGDDVDQALAAARRGAALLHGER
jgi:5-(carboxyamino)imidazole ribonucleotide synthase